MLNTLQASKANSALRSFLDQFKKAKIHVTGVYMATDATDPGIEVSKKWVLQYASYCKPSFFLDRVEQPGEEIHAFSTLDEVIQFLAED